MKLSVGLLGGNQEGWELLLRQEGVPYSIVKNDSGPFNVLVACGAADAETLEIASSHCRGGGALLCSGSVYAGLAGTVVKKRSVSYLIDGDGPPFDGLGLIDVYSICERIPGANRLYDKLKKPAIFAGTWKDAPVIALPFDPGKLVQDGRWSTKSFPATVRRLPFERVSLVSKGTLRILVGRSLEYLFHCLGLPYAHSWYYPSSEVTRYCFRIDTDGAGVDEIRRLYEVLGDDGITATWFLDSCSQRRHLGVYRTMTDQEFGAHGERHRSYPDYQRNFENFRTAIDTLRDAGIEPHGAAAPYGHWNVSMMKAFADLGIEYSSEFSYDYDNLPSVPAAGEEGGRILQVPVHPISIGSLRRQGFSEGEMKEYFEALASQRLAMREPLMMYHHPKNGNESVLRTFFAFCAAQKIQGEPMLSRARWWKTRSGLRPEFTIEENTMTTDGGTPPPGLMVHVTKGDGTECWVPFGTGNDLAGLRWTSRPTDAAVHPDIRRTRRFNPWIPLIRMEDYLHNSFNR